MVEYVPIQDLTKEIDAISKGQGSHHVQRIGGVLRALEGANLAWRLRVKPEMVGIHPHNRDGQGCNARDVHGLLVDLLKIGFDPNIPRAVAVEVPSHMQAEVMKFNKALSENADAAYPLAPCGPIRYASLGASHLNQALCLVSAGMQLALPDEGLTNALKALCPGGALSLDLVRRHDGLLGKAVHEGLEWLVISYKVMEDFPSFGRCVQEYLNAPNQFARREGELQLCRRIQRAVEAHGGAVSFATIRDEILRSKPAGSASAPFLFAFVVKFASNLLQETESYVKGHASAEKLLGPEFWDAVSTENRKTGQPFVLVRHAMVRLAYTSEKVCNPSDVRKMLGAHERTGALEALLKEVRELSLKGLGCIPIEVLTWEKLAIAWSLDKKYESVQEFKSLQGLIQACIDVVHDRRGVKLSSKWEEFKHVDAASSSASKQDRETLRTGFEH